MLNEKCKRLAAEISLGEESKPTMRNTRSVNNAVHAKERSIIFLKGRGGGMNNFPLNFFFLCTSANIYFEQCVPADKFFSIFF